MSNPWIDDLIGFILGVVASSIVASIWTLSGRRRAWNAAHNLAGTWEAYSMDGRNLDPTPMKGAGLTTVASKPHWWSADSGVLDVYSEDIDPSTGRRRVHDGAITIDPQSPLRATRIDRYADSNERSEQQLVIDPDFNVVYVFPIPAVATLGDVYAKHAWRRKC